MKRAGTLAGSPAEPAPLANAAWLGRARKARFAVGLVSRVGRRESNQDVVGWHEGGDIQKATHGAVALLADGMGGAKAGGLAAMLACETFIDAYFAQSPTLGVAVAAERALSSYNRWLHTMGRVDPNMTNAGCTFTALVLKGRMAHMLHVGDSRAWHLREGRLHQLSVDHKPAGLADTPYLSRALGLEQELRIDHAVIPLQEHDRLLLTSDGVHGALTAQALEEVLNRRGPPESAAGQIVDMALAVGSSDNVSAMVIDLVALPDADAAGLAALASGLPVPPAPQVGEVIDGLVLELQLSDGEQTRAFVARRQDGGERLVAKFPRPERTGERAAREAFVRERLIAARVDSPHIVRIIALAPEAQSRVYTLMPFYDGETLEARLKRGTPPYAEGLNIAAQLARGIIALHRMGIVHRDIKPDNVLVDQDGGVRLGDFGVALIPRLEEPRHGEVPGSHGYLAPELYRGERGDEASDQFAFGATLYRLFTGQFPFTDLQSLQRPGYDSPADPVALRPDMPAWLALALRQSVQVDPRDRFGDMIEVLHVLERGSERASPRPPALSIAQRNPLLLWQLLSLVLALAVIGLLLRR